MITFPSTVLLATDGSSHGVNARLAAADICVRSGASLHLVHAWHRTTGPLSLPQEKNLPGVSSMLARERDLLASAGAPVAATHAPEGGWPAERILSVARGVGADLLVIGSRHLGRLQRAIDPPTSEGLLRRSTIPLLVVQDDPGAWPPARILAGDDGSRVAHDAAVLAAHLGRTLGCPVEMVEIVDPSSVGASAPARVMAEVLEGVDQRAAEVEEEVGTSLDGTFRFHRTAAAGLRAAGAAGDTPVLLAVGHRAGRRPGEHEWTSVAGRLLAEGATTVLVCPAPALQLIRRRRTAVRTSR